MSTNETHAGQKTIIWGEKGVNLFSKVFYRWVDWTIIDSFSRHKGKVFGLPSKDAIHKNEILLIDSFLKTKSLAWAVLKTNRYALARSLV